MFGTLIALGIGVALFAIAADAVGEEASALQAETKRRIDEGKDNAAEIAERFEGRTYVAPSGDSILYRFLAPDGYDPDQRYPLVVCLHGRSGRGLNNVRNIGANRPAQVLSEPEMRERYPSFLLAPQTPPDRSWGYALDDSVMAGFHRRARGGRSMGVPIDEPVMALIRDVVERWPVDPDRIYLTGQSMGGAGSWYLAATHPQTFAAVMPICGFASPSYADSLADVPVWAFHGELDAGISANFSRDMVAAIRAAGGSPRYTEFEGIGHACMPLVFDDPDVLEWLFAQKRSDGR
jgi:predicted peptidase